MARAIKGRLNGVHADPGTILGPTYDTREYLAVVENDENGVLVGFATPDEMAATTRTGARSVTEYKLEVAARSRLF